VCVCSLVCNEHILIHTNHGMSRVSKKERKKDYRRYRVSCCTVLSLQKIKKTISNAYSMAVAGLGFCTVVRLQQAKLSWQGSSQASSLLKVMGPSRMCGLYPYIQYFRRLLRILMLLIVQWIITAFISIVELSPRCKLCKHRSGLHCIGLFVCWPVLHQCFVHGG
jgi:hypothetical protein